MLCWHCGHPMIWGSDFDLQEMNWEDGDGIVSMFSCSNCPATAEVTLISTQSDD